LSWQIVPTILQDMITDSEHERSQRVMTAMLQMTKLNIDELKLAYAGT
jgi:predicted 3-demethylubiquinone-9 3-methyltransferase (glyoxalase superfamily)